MADYQPPLRDMEFVLFDLLRADDTWQSIPALADTTRDLVRAVLEEGGKIAANALAGCNQAGDREGAKLIDGEVVTATGFKGAFQALASGGWLGVSGRADVGGQGLPKMLTVALEEMFYGTNTGLYLCGTLTVGAATCISNHGTQAQQALYLPKLYAGEWTGAMALTESHAGTDLGIMRTRAEPKRDGSFAITGTKIFITYGDHDLAENVIHLVLAKLPDAPEGTRGISLFLVPKFLVEDDGSLGARNTMSVGSLEHKMGVKGSPTCVMNYEAAVGFLVGEPNQGLAAMFTMMNYERLSVGIQGLGTAEAAYQVAARYAAERLQGRSPTGPENTNAAADPILVHPDVRRMLLTVRAYNEGGRAFAALVGRELDLAKYAEDAQVRERAERMVGLLTPVAKAHLTDRGFEGCVLAQQVFGGHGYIAEWGMEQFVRDVRIAQIYEGTNGVQALDLIGRKVVRDGGATAYEFLDRLRDEGMGDARFAGAVSDALDGLQRVTASIIERAADDPALPGAVSSDYLDLFALVSYAWLFSRMSELAPDDDFGAAKRATAAYFFARLLPRQLALEAAIAASADVVTALAAERF
ncbi:MAG: acyl-CoA dehydrogenase [Gammaproteobacteria bacterium]|nr:acyl-CoA dehydrogenase [Gammaproteobacteria bacterium]